MPVLFALQTAFSLWMLYDAINRRAPVYWFVVVMVPFGEWAYFFAVKIHDFKPLAGRLITRPVSLQRLEYEARKTPSIHNKTVLAQALYDRGRFDRAGELFHEILQEDDRDREAMYGYALCARRLERFDESLAALEELARSDFSFRDHVPIFDLAHAYWIADRHDEAIARLQRVVRTSSLIEPRVRLARYLHQRERADEARAALSEGLEDYQHSPRFVRRRDRSWARDARRLLAQL